MKKHPNPVKEEQVLNLHDKSVIENSYETYEKVFDNIRAIYVSKIEYATSDEEIIETQRKLQTLLELQGEIENAINPDIEESAED